MKDAVQGARVATRAGGRDARPLRVDGWRIWQNGIVDGPSGAGPSDADGAVAVASRWIELVDAAETVGKPLHRSKHATTYRESIGGTAIYLKLYRRYRIGTAIKDLARRSKAHHVLRISAELADAGFRVPRVVAAGEERRGRWIRRSWIATAPIEAVPLGEHLLAIGGVARVSVDRTTRAATPRAASERLQRKRTLLAALGREVARLHSAGFIAGDLVPANVWVADDGAAPSFVFLDHDRTCRVGRAAPWWRARRNLVQLNRVVLPGVVLTDRLRVYLAYAAGRGWTPDRARRKLRWIVTKTIERRRRFDHAVFDRRGVSFRELMRAGGPFAPREEAS